MWYTRRMIGIKKTNGQIVVAPHYDMETVGNMMAFLDEWGAEQTYVVFGT